jgi:Arsenate reductase and related proteins, glutaredoxin family
MIKISFSIYHNPRCSKSRKALEILNSKTKDFKIIKYLENGIDIIELKSILSLNKISKDQIIRTNESSYKELKLTKEDLSKDAIINYIYKFPILLQRPIICKYQNNRLIQSVVGRPPETVLSLFN